VNGTRQACGDLHPTLAAHRAAREVDPREALHQRVDRFGAGVFGRWVAEEVTAPSQGASTRAVREQAEVANAHEAGRQDVQEKPTKEFVDLEGHHLAPVVVGVVLPVEAHHALVQTEESVVGQGDAVRIAPEVLEQLLGPRDGAFGIHHPIEGTQPTEEGTEGVAIG